MKKERKFVYEGEAWVRLTLVQRSKPNARSAFVLEVRPDTTKGVARWGPVKRDDRPRKRKR